MAEQRYQAVLAVISDGLSISQVAEKFGVSRQTLHANQELWLRARIMNEQWMMSFRRTCVSPVVLGEAATVQGSV